MVQVPVCVLRPGHQLQQAFRNQLTKNQSQRTLAPFSSIYSNDARGTIAKPKSGGIACRITRHHSTRRRCVMHLPPISTMIPPFRIYQLSMGRACVRSTSLISLWWRKTPITSKAQVSLAGSELGSSGNLCWFAGIGAGVKPLGQGSRPIICPEEQWRLHR